MLPRPSYDVGKEEIKIWCHTYLLNWIEQSIQLTWQLTASSWHQIFHSPWLYICISIWIFQLMRNICDCFFSCATWVIIWALFVMRLYHHVYERFPPHFTLVMNHLKHQFDQSLSTSLLLILLRIQPIRLDWSPGLPGSFTVSLVAMSPK